MVFREDTVNNRKIFKFTYSSLYAFGNCLIDFPKIFILGVNCPFWVQNWCVTIFLYLRTCLKEFFWMLHSEKGHEVDQKSVNGFPKIFLFAANWTFWTQKWHVYLDQLLKKNPKSLIFLLLWALKCFSIPKHSP